MISLHNKIERDFREWLIKNGEAGATFGEQGRYTVINLTEDAEGEFAAYLDEFCKAEAFDIKNSIGLSRSPEFFFRDAKTLMFQRHYTTERPTKQICEFV